MTDTFRYKFIFYSIFDIDVTNVKLIFRSLEWWCDHLLYAVKLYDTTDQKWLWFFWPDKNIQWKMINLHLVHHYWRQKTINDLIHLERIDNFFSLFKSFELIEPVALTMVTSMLILTKKYYKIFQIDSNYLRIKINYFAL